MYMPGRGVKIPGRPELWVSKSNTVMCSRSPPENSGITAEILVVRAIWPSSMARNTSTLVIALVTENMLNTESVVRGLVPSPSAAPIACCIATSPLRAMVTTAP